MPIPDRLRTLIGTEHSIEHVSRSLREYATDLNATVVGAYHISCSDESERECVEAFQDNFVVEMLPELKYWSRSAFRTANLGARYEAGAIAVAEDHFATPETEEGFKLLVVKLNTHVSVANGEDGVEYGCMSRYERQSVYCGALHMLLKGAKRAFVDELCTLFRADGTNRVEILRSMPKRTRSLSTAIVASVLQSRRVVADIQSFPDRTPTVYLVASAVTLNREVPDTEFLCGVWHVDSRGDQEDVSYVGLSDDPRRYAIEHKLGKLFVHQ